MTIYNEEIGKVECEKECASYLNFVSYSDFPDTFKRVARHGSEAGKSGCATNTYALFLS